MIGSMKTLKLVMIWLLRKMCRPFIVLDCWAGMLRFSLRHSNPKPIVYSGMCLCGHSVSSHHCCCVMDPYAAKVLGDVVPDECNHFGSNELGGLDEAGELHCAGFVDQTNPDAKVKAKWKGTKR